ncbi:MAG: nucleotidyltransferase family protein, partial [Pseudoxanthomonas sp.]
MLPPLNIVRDGLRVATEALAGELARARPSGTTPAWSGLQWQLASAAAAAHGVSPLLSRFSTWQNPHWRRFLESQREHVAHRHRRIAALLKGIDAGARAAGLAVVPLKGSALHALGLYAPGERPMADIDLLVRESDAAQAIRLLLDLGYVESFVQWKHRVFKPATGQPSVGLGEHRDTPVNIELHTRIQERLPISTIDITERIYLRESVPGLNPYPSNGALMSHLLLHAAGNICGRSMRLLHLNDISLLATRMTSSDWNI